MVLADIIFSRIFETILKLKRKYFTMKTKTKKKRQTSANHRQHKQEYKHHYFQNRYDRVYIDPIQHYQLLLNRILVHKEHKNIEELNIVDHFRREINFNN